MPDGSVFSECGDVEVLFVAEYEQDVPAVAEVLFVEGFDVGKGEGLCLVVDLFADVVVEPEPACFFEVEEDFGFGEALGGDFLDDAVACGVEELWRLGQMVHEFADAVEGFGEFVGLGADVADDVVVFVALFGGAVDGEDGVGECFGFAELLEDDG